MVLAHTALKWLYSFTPEDGHNPLGNYVYIFKLESNYCLVAVLRRYIQAADIELFIQLPLFSPLEKKKLGYTLRNGILS